MKTNTTKITIICFAFLGSLSLLMMQVLLYYHIISKAEQNEQYLSLLDDREIGNGILVDEGGEENKTFEDSFEIVRIVEENKTTGDLFEIVKINEFEKVSFKYCTNTMIFVNTNFEVNEEMKNSISKITGINNCFIDDRYSMTVHTGRLFNQRDIVRDIVEYLTKTRGINK